MGEKLKYRLIKKFKQMMLADGSNLLQHVFFKYQTYNWWKLYRKVANERVPPCSAACAAPCGSCSRYTRSGIHPKIGRAHV